MTPAPTADNDPGINGPGIRRGRRGRRERARRPRRIIAVVGLGVLAVAVLTGALFAVAYASFVGEAQRTRAELDALAARVSALRPDASTAELAAIRVDLDAASAHVDRLADAAAHDALLGVARIVPLTRDQLDGARAVLSAGQSVLAAARDGLDLGDRFLAIRDRQSVTGSSSRLEKLVEFMATTGTQVDQIAADLAAARAAIAAMPTDLWGPIRSARDLIEGKLDTVMPALDRYRRAAAILPDILGWDRPRRYLILDQSPPELRPTGGYTGSFGIVVFDRGRIASLAFHDVYWLDARNDYPCIPPPAALAGYLLGRQCWQLADANWSPDFPTSARDALRLYANESGDTRIDGVFGLTTYAIDDLLAVTGPITVPGTDVTIAAGETTFKVLANTRVSSTPSADRKAFLGIFAGALIERVLQLPASQWPALLDALGTSAADRDAAMWFVDPDPRALATDWGFDGAVRQDPGDYLFAVDANVSPVSKLDYVTSRAMTDAIVIDAFGNAQHTLTIDWSNAFDASANAPYRILQSRGGTNLGHYTRLLTPWRSRLTSVSGGSYVRLTGAEDAGEEAGRNWWGVYVQIPPGSTRLRESWTAPYAADFDGTTGTYILTIQKQMGRLADAFDLTITVPEGSRIVEATGGLSVSGRTARLTTTLTRDLVVAVRYVVVR